MYEKQKISNIVEASEPLDKLSVNSDKPIIESVVNKVEDIAEIPIKIIKTRKPKTEKQMEAFKLVQAKRKANVQAKKELGDQIKADTMAAMAKRKQDMAKPKTVPESDSSSSEEETIIKRKSNKSKKKKKKKIIIIESSSDSDSSSDDSEYEHRKRSRRRHTDRKKPMYETKPDPIISTPKKSFFFD
jgi:hypothetical protein